MRSTASGTRRNLSDADLLRWKKELDKRQTAGRKPKELAQPCANLGKSAEKTAEVLGVSARKVERMRTITDHAPEEVKGGVIAFLPPRFWM